MRIHEADYRTEKVVVSKIEKLVLKISRVVSCSVTGLEEDRRRPQDIPALGRPRQKLARLDARPWVSRHRHGTCTQKWLSHDAGICRPVCLKRGRSQDSHHPRSLFGDRYRARRGVRPLRRVVADPEARAYCIRSRQASSSLRRMGLLSRTRSTRVSQSGLMA